jgi:uncharacterized protein
VHERESDALLEYLAQPLEAVTSTLSLTEVMRALQRHSSHADDDPAGLLEAFAVLDLTPGICRTAGALAPATLRTLDALHLATALSIGDPALELVTYGARLARAAAGHGVIVTHPGRRALTAR